MKHTTAELQAELESIIAWFESEEVKIDNASEQYERGLQIAAELQKRLQNTQNKITKLKQTFTET
ncbi:MAG: exodeoxyribonuclease VII small subunit [bacterium]|nr:exodeoxyribonuclease VII small subunit [bacterium]